MTIRGFPKNEQVHKQTRKDKKMEKKKYSVFRRCLASVLTAVTVISSVLTGVPFDMTMIASAASTYGGTTAINWGTNINSSIVNAGLKRLGSNYANNQQQSWYSDTGWYDCSNYVYWCLKDAGFTNVPWYPGGTKSGSTNSFVTLATTGTFTDNAGNIQYLEYDNTKVPVLVCNSVSEYTSAINNSSYAGYCITLKAATSYKDCSSSGLLKEGTIVCSTYNHTALVVGGMTFNGSDSSKSTYNYATSSRYKSLDTNNKTLVSDAYIGAYVWETYLKSKNLTKPVLQPSNYHDTWQTILKLWGYNLTLYGNDSTFYQGLHTNANDTWGNDGKYIGLLINTETSQINTIKIEAGSSENGVYIDNYDMATDSTTGTGSSKVYLIYMKPKTSYTYYYKIGVQKHDAKNTGTTVSATYKITDGTNTKTVTTNGTDSTVFSYTSTSSTAPTKTFYITETTSPTGYVKNGGMWTVTMTGTTNSSGSGSKITGVTYNANGSKPSSGAGYYNLGLSTTSNTKDFMSRTSNASYLTTTEQETFSHYYPGYYSSSTSTQYLYTYDPCYYYKFGIRKHNETTLKSYLTGSKWAVWSSDTIGATTATVIDGIASNGTSYSLTGIYWATSSTKTFYMAEIQAPTGYAQLTGVYKITMSGGRDTDGNDSTITSVVYYPLATWSSSTVTGGTVLYKIDKLGSATVTEVKTTDGDNAISTKDTSNSTNTIRYEIGDYVVGDATYDYLRLPNVKTYGGTLSLKKTDDNGNPIAGVVYAVVYAGGTDATDAIASAANTAASKTSMTDAISSFDTYDDGSAAKTIYGYLVTDSTGTAYLKTSDMAKGQTGTYGIIGLGNAKTVTNIKDEETDLRVVEIYNPSNSGVKRDMNIYTIGMTSNYSSLNYGSTLEKYTTYDTTMAIRNAVLSNTTVTLKDVTKGTITDSTKQTNDSRITIGTQTSSSTVKNTLIATDGNNDVYHQAAFVMDKYNKTANERVAGAVYAVCSTAGTAMTEDSGYQEWARTARQEATADEAIATFKSLVPQNGNGFYYGYFITSDSGTVNMTSLNGVANTVFNLGTYTSRTIAVVEIYAPKDEDGNLLYTQDDNVYQYTLSSTYTTTTKNTAGTLSSNISDYDSVKEASKLTLTKTITGDSSDTTTNTQNLSTNVNSYQLDASDKEIEKEALKGQIEVNKVDEAGVSLDSITFEVYKQTANTNGFVESELVEKIITNTKGNASLIVSNIGDGVTADGEWEDKSGVTETKTFYIKESDTNNGVVVSTTIIKAVVTGADTLENSKTDYFEVNTATTPWTETKITGVPTVINKREKSYSVEKQFEGETESLVKDITFTLYKDGTAYQTITVTSADNWKYTFENIDYYGTGTTPAVYTSEETGLTLTNGTILKGNNNIKTFFNETSVDVTDEDGNITGKVFTNAIKTYQAKLVTYKTDNEGNHDIQATFGIYESEADGLAKTNEIAKITVDTNTGLAEYNIPVWNATEGNSQTYYIRELSNDGTHTIFPYTIKAVATGNEDISKCTVVYTLVNTEQIGDIPLSSLQSDGGYTITVVNYPTEVYISKKDITDSSELSGAKLSIYSAVKESITNEDATVTDYYEQTSDTPYVLDGTELTWVSDGTEKVIKALPVGDYILVEETAPDGYTKAESVGFTVTDNKITSNVVMYDKPTHLQVNKYKAGTVENLANADLAIYKVLEDGSISDTASYTWTSTDGTYDITKIPVGKYILREISAPSGYFTADDVEFEVVDTGDIQSVKMEDSPISMELPTTGKSNGIKVIAISSVCIIMGTAFILFRKRKRRITE